MALGWASSFAAQPAAAQVVIAAPAAAGQEKDANAPQHPFNMPIQKNDVAEALADFRRYASRGTWERAFKALDKVQEADPNALTPREEGLLMPTRVLVRQALAELPPAGKQAYRVFHDSEAKVLVDAATGKDEQEKLQKVFTQYFITTVGDVAADRLGDIYFEQGEMDRAVECWQSVITYRPESSLPRVGLLVKSAIALARGGRWNDFDECRRQVHERHAGEKVVLGGKDVVAEAHLAALESERSQDTAATVGSSPSAEADLTLPKTPDPAWQFHMFTARQAQQIASVGANWGWGMRFPVADMVPPVATDGQRVYMNLLGYHLALDVQTGKLLWRSAKFHELPQKVQQNQAHSPEQYSLAVAGDTLWSVFRDVGQIGQQGAPFRIGRFEAATGKAGWNSQTVGELQNWNMVGAPLPLGDRVFVAASKQGQGSELHLLALNAADGKLQWSTHLGTHQSDPTQQWYRRSPQPSLVAHGGRIYVDTHAGALAAVDAAAGAIEWGFYYESEMTANNNMWWGYNTDTKQYTAARPLIVGNTMYFKGMRSPRLYAIDLTGPKLLWKRAVSETAMLIGTDRATMFLGGEEVEAIDLAGPARALKWATRLPASTGWVRPVMTEHRVYEFTSRGIFELDKSTGDRLRMYRGADLDSLGGTLLVLPGRLLSVSNLAVTCYVVDDAARPEVGESVGRKGL